MVSKDSLNGYKIIQVSDCHVSAKRDADYRGSSADRGLAGLLPVMRKWQPDLVAEFEPGTEKLEFHYTALSYAVPKKVKFRYMLEGYDKFQLFQLTVDKFQDADYSWIGIDHFAKPADGLAVALDPDRVRGLLLETLPECREGLGVEG